MTTPTIWLTGLPGAGKTTLAVALRSALQQQGRACCVLDGDEIRSGLSSDLGFGSADRHENVRRVAEIARLLNVSNVIAIVAMVSPLLVDRQRARHIVGAENFREVYVDAPVETCLRRDPKGMYKRARSGEIQNFTGLTAPYEPPHAPELRLQTEMLSLDECLQQALSVVC